MHELEWNSAAKFSQLFNDFIMNYNYVDIPPQMVAWRLNIGLTFAMWNIHMRSKLTPLSHNALLTEWHPSFHQGIIEMLIQRRPTLPRAVPPQPRNHLPQEMSTSTRRRAMKTATKMQCTMQKQEWRNLPTTWLLLIIPCMGQRLHHTLTPAGRRANNEAKLGHWSCYAIFIRKC